MADVDTLKWVRRASALLLLTIGWVFILANNHFHLTAASLFIGFGYTAAVAAVYTLFRTGATAVATNAEDIGTAEWGAPMGPRGELEREKRMLLKAIREAEFDYEMGKLSKTDADLMIAQYRARAIAIIKQLDTVEGESASTRTSIEREIRARMELGSAKLKGKKVKGKPAKAAPVSELAASKIGDKQSVAAVDPEDASDDDDEDDTSDEPRAEAHEYSDSTAAPADKPEAKAAPVVEAKAEPVVEAKAEPAVEGKAEPVVETKPAPEPVAEPKPHSNGAPKQAASGTTSGKNKSGKGGKKAAKKESA